jgi:hypothetical protein
MTNARDLSARLADLLRREHGALADFLLALADFDGQRLWLDLGHPSLFSFLHRELGLSKGAAYYRKTAAELVQRFPEVIAPLRDGRLCFTSVVELAKVLTPENAGEVLPRFFHCSKGEAKALSAAILPDEAAPQRDVVTAVPAAPVRAARASAGRLLPAEPMLIGAGVGIGVGLARGNGEPAAGPSTAVHLDEPLHANPPPAPPSAPTSRARDGAEPLTADLRRLHVTVSRRFLAKLEAARAALSHSHPGASMEEILEVGLELVLDLHAKRRGLVAKPRRERRPSKPDHIPAEVKREVWKRDEGKCQWRLDSGGICASTLRVEIDHSLAEALGGLATVENLRLLCRGHNDLAARRTFGDEWMNRYTSGGRSRGAPREEGAARPAGA